MVARPIIHTSMNLGLPSPSRTLNSMAKTEASEPLLPPQPQFQPQYQGYHGFPAPAPIQEPLYEQPYILLPLYRRTRYRRRYSSGGFCRCFDVFLTSSALLFLGVSLFVLASAAFILWPSDPQISIVRLGLDHISVVTDPAPSLDIAMDIKIRLRNPDFFSLDYHSIVVSIGYRGKPLGFVKSDGGHVRARGVSYIDAKLRLNGIQVIHDAFYLIEDLARDSIPLDTVTDVQGKLNFFFLDLPIQGRISCSVHVNPEDQTVTRQECYPE